MEDLNNQICTKCYMFYGSKENNFMCSKCFRGIENKIADNLENKVPIIQKEETEEKIIDCSKKEEIKIDKSKCKSCNKKLGFLGIECLCSFFFCKKHRLPESHNCDFDFKKKGKDELALKNPKLIEKKLNNF